MSKCKSALNFRFGSLSEYASKRFGKTSTMAPLVLPYVEGEHRRIIYTITEYEPLLDSSNMTFQDWVKIAQDIKVRVEVD
jgi:60kDa lysophospholipase